MDIRITERSEYVSKHAGQRWSGGRVTAVQLDVAVREVTKALAPYTTVPGCAEERARNLVQVYALDVDLSSDDMQTVAGGVLITRGADFHDFWAAATAAAQAYQQVVHG